jgi:hypothetical protein
VNAAIVAYDHAAAAMAAFQLIILGIIIMHTCVMDVLGLPHKLPKPLSQISLE